MTGGELFEAACKAWDIEVRTKTDNDFKIGRTLHKDGKQFDITWSPEVAMDLAAFHGEGAEHEMAVCLIVAVARELLGLPKLEEKAPGDTVALQDSIRAVPLEYLDAKERMQIIRRLGGAE